jgi:hypothetical protein
MPRCSLQERFWKKVAITTDESCWLWTAGCNDNGYGNFKVNGVCQKAHRIAYELEFGLILPGFYVLHYCDNPPCCRPDHLFLGTHDDNMRDMAIKGRKVKTIKVSPDGVRAIRERRLLESLKTLASEFCISESNVSLIARRKRRKSVA